jgi:hypothetical protein
VKHASGMLAHHVFNLTAFRALTTSWLDKSVVINCKPPHCKLRFQ